MAGAGLKHWMLHNDQLARELDETLKLSPGYDPVRDVDPALTFHAPLLTGPDSIPGAIKATVERNSEAIYRAPRGALLISAADDESRHEYTPNDEPLGALMEPASTNSSGVDNLERVDPSDWLLSGGPATIERIVDHDLIASAGLTKLCPNGELLRITAESNCRFLLSPSSPGSTEDLGLSVYARGRFFLHSGYASSSQFIHETLKRAEYIDTAGNAARVFSISVNAGDVCEFIGWGIEIQHVVTSLIHTPFGPASRAVDRLSWPLVGDAGSILNQSEGMAAIIIKLGFGFDDVGANTQHGILSLRDGVTSLIYLNRATTTSAFVTQTRSAGGNVATASIPGNFERGDVFVAAVRWNLADNLQVLCKRLGQWYAGGGTFDTEWETEQSLIAMRLPTAPIHGQHVHVWSKDRGRDWLEKYFEGVAN